MDIRVWNFENGGGRKIFRVILQLSCASNSSSQTESNESEILRNGGRLNLLRQSKENGVDEDRMEEGVTHSQTVR